MLSCYETAGLPAMTKGVFTQFTEVSIRGKYLLVYFFVDTHPIFQGVYARGRVSQLRKLAKQFKYCLLPKPQLRDVRYTTLRSELANIFN